VEALAQHCNVSARALQQGFRRYKGTTPMALLREIRLERARQDLLEAGPEQETSVSVIASRWGFAHLGRFTHYYRQRFNELPSQALRRR
jgi:transcriptional regulator GlxA family with amidase domain